MTPASVAASKSLICSPATEAGVMCAARAQPCTIQQVQGQPLPGTPVPDQKAPPPATPKVLKPAPKQLNI
jgi:hypothetical protein